MSQLFILKAGTYISRYETLHCHRYHRIIIENDGAHCTGGRDVENKKGLSPFQNETHKSHVRTHPLGLGYPCVTYFVLEMEMPTTEMEMLVCFFFCVSTEYMKWVLDALHLAVATKYIQLQIHFQSGRELIKRSRRMRIGLSESSRRFFTCFFSVCSRYCWAESRWKNKKKRQNICCRTRNDFRLLHFVQVLSSDGKCLAYRNVLPSFSLLSTISNASPNLM